LLFFLRFHATNMILIIAYGNDLREDDGAGLILAERLACTWRLRGTPAHLVAVHQLAPELAADILEKDVTAVVFADARVSTSPGDGDVSVAPLEPAAEQSPSLGHHVQPEVLLSYARLLVAADSLPPAWLVTVPGMAFGYGERLSEVAQAAIRRAFENQSSPLSRLVTELAASTLLS
jgi:hydrogenase maturation protease